jgi:hypothetical protein
VAPWLFTTGVSLEVAGAMMIVAPLLGPILGRRWNQIASKGWLFPRSGPTEADLREFVFAVLGALMLALGFVTQLSGYVVTYADGWLALAAFGVILWGFILGYFFAAPRLGRWLLEKARVHDETARAQAARAR